MSVQPSPEFLRQRTASWKAAGLCSRCGKLRAKAGRTRCPMCLTYDAERRNSPLALSSTSVHTLDGSTRSLS